MQRHDDKDGVIEHPSVPGRCRSDGLLAYARGQWTSGQGVLVVIGKKPEHALQAEKQQHHQDHNTAERIVPEIPARAPQQKVRSVSQPAHRRIEERGKTRRRAAGEAPEDPENDQNEDRVSVPDVPAQVATVDRGQVSAEHEQGQCPVKEPRRQVPGRHAARGHHLLRLGLTHRLPLQLSAHASGRPATGKAVPAQFPLSYELCCP